MKKGMTIGSLIMILIFSLTFQALAAGGTGDGGGSGQPLTLVSSSVPDGTADVALDMKLTLTFSKNVVNMAVWDHNLTCFALSDSKGGAVGIDVLMGDDQVDPDIKNTVEIKPQVKLSPDTVYTLTISGNLTSKSGVSMGQAVNLTFTTVRAPAAAPTPSATPAPAPLPSSTPSSEPSPGSTVPVSPSTAPQTAPSSSQTVPTIPSPTPGVPSTGISPPDAAVETDQSAPSDNPQVSDNNGSDAEGTGNQQGSPIPYILGGAAVILIIGAVVAVVRNKK